MHPGQPIVDSPAGACLSNRRQTRVRHRYQSGQLGSSLRQNMIVRSLKLCRCRCLRHSIDPQIARLTINFKAHSSALATPALLGQTPDSAPHVIFDETKSTSSSRRSRMKLSKKEMFEEEQFSLSTLESTGSGGRAQLRTGAASCGRRTCPSCRHNPSQRERGVTARWRALIGSKQAAKAVRRRWRRLRV